MFCVALSRPQISLETVQFLPHLHPVPQLFVSYISLSKYFHHQGPHGARDWFDSWDVRREWRFIYHLADSRTYGTLFYLIEDISSHSKRKNPTFRSEKGEKTAISSHTQQNTAQHKIQWKLHSLESEKPTGRTIKNVGQKNRWTGKASISRKFLYYK